MSGKSILILLRHAARDMSDDGLSETGLKQADTLPGRILKAFSHLGLTSPDSVSLKIKSSPKARTRATLRTLSKELSISIEVDARLDERTPGERVDVFEKRVESFLEEAALRVPTGETWVACSHLDWLEHASLVIPSDENDFERSEPWPPMTIRIYIFENGIWQRAKGKI